MNRLFLMLSILLFSLSTEAQKENRIGVGMTGEKTGGGGFTAGLGATFERKFSRHSGFETGLFYRTNRQHYYLQIQNNFYSLTAAERYLSIPFLYKFYSLLINFSVGPTIDFFVGWKQKNKRGEAVINSYSLSKNVYLGGMIKLSKEIKLSREILLEPGLRLNPIIGSNTVYGGGVAVKYKLTGK